MNILTIKKAEDLDQLKAGDKCNFQGGCLTKATRHDQNFAQYTYKFSDGNSVHIYDGDLARFKDYEILYDKQLECQFKIKVKNNHETVDSFYQILKCYDIENDVEREKNFFTNPSEKVVKITFDHIGKDKSCTNNHSYYMKSFDGIRFTLFLNNQNESQKLEKIGLNLSDYWPLNDEFEQILIEKIKDIELNVHYIERIRGNNITCIEFSQN